ncbi:DUF397 domain-containing protein [Streptomyces sp. NPDC048825]|uniref:DUF397 domain-containing protein n=1 Tax=Streptomyces sp. NPDC048825 TaxID=3365592 RepID=UPI003714409F
MNGFDFVKSSCSTGSGECVEVARNIRGVVAVRDSETAPTRATAPYSAFPRPAGPTLPTPCAAPERRVGRLPVTIALSAQTVHGVTVS